MPQQPRARPGQVDRAGRGGRTGEVWHRSSVEQLAGTPADVLVIGGGITGAGIARDAAMRGLRVVLVEQRDLASGTSSRSSRLVHGGLRYLEEGGLRLVFEALKERQVLLTIAPHLVRPLPFTFPVHQGDRVPLWKLWAGVTLYDLLAAFRNVRWHQLLGKRRLLAGEPLVRERGLVGGVRYWDAQCDDARLTLATARDAMRHGAQVATWTRVTALAKADGRVTGAHLEDALTGATGTVTATVTVNATGPWGDQLRRLEDPATQPLLRPTKGVHVLVRRDRLGHEDAITLTSPLDGRVMFVLPWGDFSYIGTTDTDTTESPDEVAATPDDIVYLLRSANSAFPNARLSEADVLATWAGLRPLVAPEAAMHASSVSREHVIVEGSGGMLTIAGGKLTTYRVMAAEVVDAVMQRLERQGYPRVGRPPTDKTPLPGGEAADLEPLGSPGLELGLPIETVNHLVRLYGTECAAIFNLVEKDRTLLQPLDPWHPAIQAEVLHVVRRELACRVEDVLVRRLHLYYEVPDHGAAAAATVAALMGRELGWDLERAAREAERYRASLPRR